MLSLKLKVGAALVLTVGILGAGAGLAAFPLLKAKTPDAGQQAKPPVAQPQVPIQGKQERADGRGNPLPEGAVLRFGSARLRHGGKIYASALSPDGKTLATAGAHSVIDWDLDTGKPLHHFRCGHGSKFVYPGLTFSPDGTRLGYVGSWFFACVWDLRTGKELRRFERRFQDGQRKLWGNRCQFTNQGKELVLCSLETIHTWNVESGAETASIQGDADLLSPDGRTFLRLEGKAGLTVGDARTGNTVTRLEVTTEQDGMAFSPDGKTLALVHDKKEIQLRDVAGGKARATFPLPDSALKISASGSKYWDYRVTFSTDGKTLLLGTVGGLIHRWDLATGKELPPLSKHYCAVWGMHTLPDGRTLVSTGDDGVIRRWDLRTGRHDAQPESYEGKSCAAYAPDCRFAAVADARGRIDLWDGRTGKLVRTLQQEGAAVTHLAFAPDSKLLAAAEQSGTVRFWQMPGGRPGPVWQRQRTPGEWYLNGLVFSPDGRLLCFSDYPKQIRVVEVANGKLLWTGQNAYGQAFSPDSATLLVGAPSGRHLTLLDAATGKKRSTVRLTSKIPDDSGVLPTLAFSPDGRRLAVAQHGNLALCDGHTGVETQRLTDQPPGEDLRKFLTGDKLGNEIRALAFSADGKWFASAGSDTDIYFWETATGKEVLRLSGHEAEVSCVAFSPDGKRVFSYGQDGQGYLWDLKPKPAARPRAALDELWTDLAGTNAGKAYRAAWALSEDPRAADFLRKKLPPAAPPDKARLAKLIADLDSNRFAVREDATRALAELAELAAPALEEARKTTTSPEQRKRLEGLLASLKGGASPVQVLQMRAVQAMELASGTNARQVLREWAGGAPAARLTQEARAALARLDKRKQ